MDRPEDAGFRTRCRRFVAFEHLALELPRSVMDDASRGDAGRVTEELDVFDRPPLFVIKVDSFEEVAEIFLRHGGDSICPRLFFALAREKVVSCFGVAVNDFFGSDFSPGMRFVSFANAPLVGGFVFSRIEVFFVGISHVIASRVRTRMRSRSSSSSASAAAAFHSPRQPKSPLPLAFFMRLKSSSSR